MPREQRTPSRKVTAGCAVHQQGHLRWIASLHGFCKVISTDSTETHWFSFAKLLTGVSNGSSGDGVVGGPSGAQSAPIHLTAQTVAVRTLVVQILCYLVLRPDHSTMLSHCNALKTCAAQIPTNAQSTTLPPQKSPRSPDQ